MLAALVPLAALQLSGGPGSGSEAAHRDVVERFVASNVRDARADGRWVLFVHEEAGVDRNGDGDATDDVYAVHDLVSGATTELGLAGDRILATGGGRALIAVSEVQQGGTDLNGDGFAFASVCFGVELASASAASSGMACVPSSGALLVGGRAVFAVSESAQGGTDFDGNGSIHGVVPAVWSSFAAAPAVVPLAIEDLLAQHQSFALFSADEEHAGDRNGDGDDDDRVLHALDVEDPSLTPVGTGLAVLDAVRAAGPRSAFVVPEDAQTVDLNGDGDLFDRVLHVFDVEGPTLTNTGLALGARSVPLGHGTYATGTEFALSDEAVAFAVSEDGQGETDLNGDGDDGDSVLFVRDLATGTTTNVGLATFHFALGEGTLAFEAREVDQGADLDGNGVLAGHVAHLHDLATHATTNLGLRTAQLVSFSQPFASTGGWLAFGALEDGADGNDDGDGVDRILHLVDVATGSSQSQHVSLGSGVTFTPDGRLAFLVHELSEGRDRNGDGDLADDVPHYLAPATGSLVRSTLEAEDFPPIEPGFARRHPVRTMGRGLWVVRLRR